jgi:phosphatidyl-myo-inositol dimannoside synthase
MSHFTKDVLVKRHGVPAEKVTVLPGVADDRLLHVRPDPEWADSVGLNGGPVLLSVARMSAIERYKGHDAILQGMPRILREVPGAKYVVVGDGDDRPRLQAEAERLGVADNVLFVGRLTLEQLAASYEASHVFALPARTVVDPVAPKGEGFGIVFLEAMLFGKPVIAPGNGAPAEFIRHGEHGLLVDPDDVEDITGAILKLLASPEEARVMGEKARTWAHSEYSFDRFRDRLQHIMQS